MHTLRMENKTQFRILYFICASHFLIDMMTSVVPAMLPILQKGLSLSYSQLGIVVMAANITASLFQPVIGAVTDKQPRPWMLLAAALFAGFGIVGIALAHSYLQVLLIVTLIGLSSAAFHPEGSRVAHMAAGPRKGLGQSIFQVGGNAGQSMGPLMIPLLFTPFGLHGAYWLLFPVVLVSLTLLVVSRWYQQHAASQAKKTGSDNVVNRYWALVLLVVVVIMRSWIQSGINSFLQLFYIDVFGYSVDMASMYLFVFLMAGAIGTFVGGPLADRYSKKNLLIFSMLGSIPFILLVPHLTGVLALVNIFLFGFISLSSFAVTVVYAQEFVPGKVGMVSGLMIGFAIGAGGIGASIMGKLADVIGIAHLIQLLVVLPVLGWLLGSWLPKDQVRVAAADSSAPPHRAGRV